MAVFDYPFSFTTSPLVVIGVCALFFVWKRIGSNRSKVPFPPGPTPLPVIGNLRDFPTIQPWITYTKWKRQYGMLYMGNICMSQS